MTQAAPKTAPTTDAKGPKYSVSSRRPGGYKTTHGRLEGAEALEYPPETPESANWRTWWCDPWCGLSGVYFGATLGRSSSLLSPSSSSGLR
eukprot:1070694-Pyramimonas_sp.AAC.1